MTLNTVKNRNSHGYGSEIERHIIFVCRNHLFLFDGKAVVVRADHNLLLAALIEREGLVTYRSSAALLSFNKEPFPRVLWDPVDVVRMGEDEFNKFHQPTDEINELPVQSATVDGQIYDNVPLTFSRLTGKIDLSIYDWLLAGAFFPHTAYKWVVDMVRNYEGWFVCFKDSAAFRDLVRSACRELEGTARLKNSGDVVSDGFARPAHRPRIARDVMISRMQAIWPDGRPSGMSIEAMRRAVEASMDGEEGFVGVSETTFKRAVSEAWGSGS